MNPTEIIVVEKLPILGSGKLDLAGIAKLAKSMNEPGALAKAS